MREIFEARFDVPLPGVSFRAGNGNVIKVGMFERNTQVQGSWDNSMNGQHKYTKHQQLEQSDQKRVKKKAIFPKCRGVKKGLI